MSRSLFHAAAFLGLLFVKTSSAFTILQPSVDRWMYPFNASPDSRPSASVFGAVGTAGFDNRDGQFLVRFDTTSIAAAGLGAGNYQIGSLTLSLTVNLDNAFFYDPTDDSYQSYLDPSAPGYVADTDAGRPVELFAVGYRNGYSESTFTAASPFAPGNPMTSGTRNAYAAEIGSNGSLVDVSNNVTGGFDVSPLSIGQIAGLASGSLVPEDSVMSFNVDLSNPEVVAWLQSSLNAGYLEFMATSLQPTTEEAASGFPSFYTKENILNDPADGYNVAGQLSGSIAVPEPKAILLLAIGGGFLMVWRRRHG